MLSLSLSLPSPTVPFFCHFSSSFLSLPMYTSFFCIPPLLLSTLPPPHLPLPSRVRSRVLTLGFVQICSLQGWKVVMRAKKNSLAPSLTTRLVFQMKPNENSIFYPCYSLPPILQPYVHPSFSRSGASNLQTNLKVLHVLLHCNAVRKIRPKMFWIN